MKILVINIDSKLPNLALEKIKLYHRALKDEVIEDLPIMRHAVDKIYVSCIFTDNLTAAAEWADYGAEVGGSGYDLHKKLSADIERIIPRINYGFVTRGCNRHCPFCIVPEKEGSVYQEASLGDIWDGKAKKVTLLDNNILFHKNAFKETCHFAHINNIELDFNQGLDHRLLNDQVCAMLKTVRHKEYRFAFDHPSEINTVDRAITLLHRYELKWSIWYVLVGFDTTLQEDIWRLEYLKARQQRPYVMRYGGRRLERKYILLAQWANQRHIFQKMTFPQLCEIKGYDYNSIANEG